MVDKKQQSGKDILIPAELWYKIKFHGSAMLIAVAIMGVILIVIGFGAKLYCDEHPSYFQDHYCFNVTLRCNIECNVHGLNFTGEIDRCDCHCGEDNYVSICTGHLYTNETLR